jgi:protein-S-isoprenylcysteine O-methyltransferase Ste14
MNIRMAKAVLILPGTALIYVPTLAVWFSRKGDLAAVFPPDSAQPWLLAAPFAIVGLWLMIWSVRVYRTHGGDGTPAPWDPIENFVATGPYLYVRNPMLIGVILFQGAEAALLQSWPVFIWMLVFIVMNMIYFPLSEEPGLEKRFGETYRDYKLNVPRWIPRLTPWVPSDK